MGAMTKTGPVRCRAAKACKACHDRRVKCDAVERGTPCTRCENYGVSPCILIKSKRGTYSRNKAGSDTGSRASVLVSASKDDTENVNPSVNTEEANRPQEPENTANESQLGQFLGEDSVVPQEPEPMVEDVIDMDRPSRINDHVSVQPAREVSNQSPTSPPNVPSSNTAPRTATTTLGPEPHRPSPFQAAGQDLSSPDTDVSHSTASSYRDISWPTMFDHFLNTRRRDRKRLIDKCSITYLGESFPLAMVLEDLEEGGSVELHFPGLPVPEQAAQGDHPPAGQHSVHMHKDDIRILTNKGVFEYPRPDILDSLMASFLSRVYPLYPIVNRLEFLDQLGGRKLPWLLLHAVCFIASTFCPISILHRANFSNRKEARHHYYSKAKALFDAGYEVNQIVTLQSTIILAFWAGGPNDFWNFYSWNSTSVTIAEALGLHRSMAKANISPQDRSLLRRLWWILTIRDASCGALLGRPFRINMDFCDTEMLTMDDFKPDSESPEFANNPLLPTYSLYQIHMARLSLILRSIIASRFAQRGRVHSDLLDRLQLWLQELPPSLQWDDANQTSNVFSRCLSILYDHHIILCTLGHLSPDIQNPMGSAAPNHFQSRFGSVSSVSPSALREGEGCASTIDFSAQRILSLACGIVRRSATLTIPHEAFPGLFLAEVVFYTQMKSRSPTRAQGAAPVGNSQCAEPNLNITDPQASASRAPVSAMTSNLPDDIMTDMPELDTGFMQDPWHSHPMLSAFLETNLSWGSPWDPPVDANIGPNLLASERPEGVDRPV